MTPQEEGMLQDLVRKVNSTPLQEKDDSAERLLQDGLGRNPDAVYVLAQTVLVQNIALEQAKRQMMALQQGNAGSQSKPTSFLGSLFGHHEPQPQTAPPPQQYQPVQYAPQSGGAQYQAPTQFQAAPSGQPSFLRSAATTAAGVAAGALAFQGVEGLLHGGGGGFGGFGGGYGDAPREEIVNNYYGDPNAGGGNDSVAGPDEQPQGGYDSGAQDSGYGDDFTDGGGDFGGDDTSFS